MGLHVPQKHLNFIKTMEHTFDITKLTDRQLKNIKKYYINQDFTEYGDDVITKHIARGVWKEHGIKSHPYIKTNWRDIIIKNYPIEDQVWNEVEKYLSLCKISDQKVYQFNIEALNSSLALLNSREQNGARLVKQFGGGESPLAKTFSLQFPNIEVQHEWRTSNNYDRRPEDCALTPILKGITKRTYPMSEDQSGIKVINSMIDRKINEFTFKYTDKSINQGDDYE